MMWREEDKNESDPGHQQHSSQVGQSDPGSDLVRWCEGIAYSNPDLGPLQPTQARDEQDQKSFKTPCHALHNQHAHA